MSSSKVEYKSIDPRQHVILRPDMYIGSVRNISCEEFVAEPETFKISYKKVIKNPGLIRIFVEMLSNCIDNNWRSQNFNVKMSSINVTIDPDTCETTVYNDGLAIHIEKNADTGLYNPELIFGKLLTSSNYNDNEKRKTSGRNGLGGKCTNIFSKRFQVRVVDPQTNLEYTQVWENNMEKVNPPTIKKSKLKNGFTEITYQPDFALFTLEKYTEDHINMMRKLCLDAAMITGLNVTFNGVKLPVKNLVQYAKLYDDTEDIVSHSTEDSEVVVMGKFLGRSISFVNGIETTDGGVHVNKWLESIFKPLIEKMNKKESVLSMRDIKNNFTLFVKCTLDNPEFSSQEKTFLSRPEPKIGDVPAKFLNSIGKWEVMDKLKEMFKEKDLKTLQKVEKKRGFKKIEGYDPANNAGTKHSKDCTLILCEGDSAKTYAVSGIQYGVGSKKGRDWFGIYPLRGKCLNVRNANATSISKNKEIVDLIQCLNLKTGTDYTDEKNFATLNYGSVMILTDADVDGIHICGLLLNFFHALFPSLLKRVDPFIIRMNTPLVRVSAKSSVKSFYSMNEYLNYEKNVGKVTGDVKYYKGLGTNNTSEIKDSFGQKMTDFLYDEKTDDAMNMAFSNTESNARKVWLEKYDPTLETAVEDEMQISEFLYKDLIKFSIDDCKRSIPNMMDGLKESQRKILYAAFKKNLCYSGKTMKVAQLVGYVAESTNYHHGEQCLGDTITKMAADFVGSQNIPLFYRDGQFGSRLEGGKDAASSRYIFTKLDRFTRLLFRKEDDELLHYLYDEGEKIEPQYYVPILPMILVNGCSAGIGTGWSCNVPQYNPKDIISNIKLWLDGREMMELTPWYRNFTGTVVQQTPVKFTTHGIMTESDRQIVVTELPVGLWTNKFKEYVEDLLENKLIRNYKNYCTPDKVHIIIEKNKEGNQGESSTVLEESTEKVKSKNANVAEQIRAKLTTTVSINNIVLFNKDGKLQKFDSINQIIEAFCKERMSLYQKRIQSVIAELTDKLDVLGNKRKFIEEVLSKKLKLFEMKEEEVLSYLAKHKYRKEDEYKYLLNIPVRQFTDNRVKELDAEIQVNKKVLEEYKNTTARTLWEKDLEEFKF